MENAAADAMNFAMAAALFCSAMGTGGGGPFFVLVEMKACVGVRVGRCVSRAVL